MVFITLSPYKKRPTAIPRDPIRNDYQSGWTFGGNFIKTMRGLIALATSLEPCETQTRKSVNTIRHLKNCEVKIAY